MGFGVLLGKNELVWERIGSGFSKAFMACFFSVFILDDGGFPFFVPINTTRNERRIEDDTDEPKNSTLL